MSAVPVERGRWRNGVTHRTPGTTWRGEQTRGRLLDVAMRHFAEHGIRDARLEEIAEEAGVTRGALLKHFGSKDELFFEAHKKAALMLAAYTEAPSDVLDEGFWATYRYWLEDDHLMHEDYVPFRLTVLGNYCSELPMQRQISRFWLTEDPEKTLDFLDMGQDRGEVRKDLDPYAVAALLDWIEDGVQRCIGVEELDRGLFHRQGDDDRRRRVIDTIIEVLRHGLEQRVDTEVPNPVDGSPDLELEGTS